MIVESVTLAFASIILLMAVYEDRPTLLLVWLTFVALEIAVALAEPLVHWPVGNTFWHMEAVTVQVGLLLYMFLVVFNYYLDAQGTGRSLWGYEYSHTNHTAGT